MQKWEYMWIYVSQEKGQQVYIANGEGLHAQTPRSFEPRGSKRMGISGDCAALYGAHCHGHLRPALLEKADREPGRYLIARGDHRIMSVVGLEAPA